MLGPRASKEQLDAYRDQILANPRNYVAQPMVCLSRVPTLVGDHLEGDTWTCVLYSLRRRHLHRPRRLDAGGPGEGFAGVNSSQVGAARIPGFSKTALPVISWRGPLACSAALADSIFW